MCNYIGISTGSLIAFLLAKRFGTGLVWQMILMEKYDYFAAWIQRKKCYTTILFLAILLPLASDDFLLLFFRPDGDVYQKFTWIILFTKPWCILGHSLFFAYFAA